MPNAKPTRAPMRAIELKMPAAMLAAVDRAARREFATRAETIRRYISNGLHRDQKESAK